MDGWAERYGAVPPTAPAFDDTTRVPMANADARRRKEKTEGEVERDWSARGV